MANTDAHSATPHARRLTPAQASPMHRYIVKLRDNISVTVGWLIFGVLIAALLTDHYIFNPFIFGFGYYIVHALRRLGDEGEAKDIRLITKRLIGVSIIALLYLWIALNSELNQRAFIRQFEETCYRSHSAGNKIATQLCEDIQSHIDGTLQRERTPFNDE